MWLLGHQENDAVRSPREERCVVEGARCDQQAESDLTDIVRYDQTRMAEIDHHGKFSIMCKSGHSARGRNATFNDRLFVPLRTFAMKRRLPDGFGF